MGTNGRVIVINPFCDYTRVEYFQTVEAATFRAGLNLGSVMNGTLMSFDNIHFRTHKKTARRPPCRVGRALSANHHSTKYSVIRLSGQLPIAFYSPNAQPILRGHL